MKLNGAATSKIVVYDRASAIANFIEEGNIPQNAKLEFKADDGLKIDLNYPNLRLSKVLSLLISNS